MTEKDYLVLVVDDHKDAINILSRYLSKEGYRVASAYSGQEALNLTEKTQPDLILLDIMMPGMNGYEVFGILQENPKTASIPVIFVTARDGITELEMGLGLGADDFLGKPVEPRNLLARVRNKIELSQLRLALRKRSLELETLLHTSEELSRHLDLADLMVSLETIIRQVYPQTACSAILIQSNQILHHWHISQELDITPDILLRDIELHFGTHQVSVWDRGFSLYGYPHGLYVPLGSPEETSGHILILAHEALGSDQLRLIEGIARQATMAIRNAEAYQIKQNYAQVLEKMVEERTEELVNTHRLLVRAEKLAAIGRFAQVMSHEVRNPLHVIGLLVEDMMATIKSGEMITLHDLEVVLHSSMRASRFVERLLEFTKQGKSSSQQIERLNISDAFKNPIILGETLYKRRQMQLIFEPTDLPYIYGSRDSLEQVFLNLIVNAADAMSAGGQLRITTRVVGKELEISFEDTGIGIAPDHLEKIFEPSFTTKEQGTGIGLFISYEIISNHNGSIDVESTVGKGTRFIVRLPLSD